VIVTAQVETKANLVGVAFYDRRTHYRRLSRSPWVDTFQTSASHAVMAFDMLWRYGDDFFGEEERKGVGGWRAGAFFMVFDMKSCEILRAEKIRPLSSRLIRSTVRLIVLRSVAA
jgi:hypothetical protein